jgi:hypothetical protein
MSERASTPRIRRQPIRTAIEVGLFFVELSGMLVTCLGGHRIWWFVGMIVSGIGLALDPTNGPFAPYAKPVKRVVASKAGSGVLSLGGSQEDVACPCDGPLIVAVGGTLDGALVRDRQWDLHALAAPVSWLFGWSSALHVLNIPFANALFKTKSRLRTPLSWSLPQLREDEKCRQATRRLFRRVFEVVGKISAGSRCIRPHTASP